MNFCQREQINFNNKNYTGWKWKIKTKIDSNIKLKQKTIWEIDFNHKNPTISSVILVKSHRKKWFAYHSPLEAIVNGLGGATKDSYSLTSSSHLNWDLKKSISYRMKQRYIKEYKQRNNINQGPRGLMIEKVLEMVVGKENCTKKIGEEGKKVASNNFEKMLSFLTFIFIKL